MKSTALVILAVGVIAGVIFFVEFFDRRYRDDVRPTQETFIRDRDIKSVSCPWVGRCSGLLPDGRPVTFECYPSGCVWVLP